MIETIAWTCDFVYSFRLHTYLDMPRVNHGYDDDSTDTHTHTYSSDSFFLLSYITSPRFVVLLLCYAFLRVTVYLHVCVCVIFCLFDFVEPALLLLHMLNMSLYHAITIVILPQVSFIWLIKFGTYDLKRKRRKKNIIRNERKKSRQRRRKKNENERNKHIYKIYMLLLLVSLLFLSFNVYFFQRVFRLFFMFESTRHAFTRHIKYIVVLFCLAVVRLASIVEFSSIG